MAEDKALPPRPRRRSTANSTLAEWAGVDMPGVASSLNPPVDDPLALTPLRAHYLKRELVTLQFVEEFKQFDSPSALSVLGPPFLPESRFKDGVPQPAPPPGSQQEAIDDQIRRKADLPFMRFVLHYFVLSFPFLANCPPTFFSHKLQPFVLSFVSRNISTSEDREEETKRKQIAGKIEKHLGLIVSSAIKLVENDGKEEVVRIREDDFDPYQAGAATAPELVRTEVQRNPNLPKDEDFSINVVSVRTVTIKGRMRNKSHEEFIVKTHRKGFPDVYVARRYGDFVRLAETLRSECLEEHVRGPPPKDRRSSEYRPGASPPSSTPPSPATPAQGTDSPRTSIDGSRPVNPTAAPVLARERNRLTLRAYLRGLLANPTLANADAFRSFLTETPIQLNQAELRDVHVREEMDRVREEELKRFRSEVEGRVRDLENHLRSFREDLIRRDGLTRVFATIREKNSIEELPIQYRKVFEWARISLAATVYSLCLGQDNSSSFFAQLKRIHGLMPYFMLRGILRISNPVAMVRGVLDLFLARPFGSTSLLQRMFAGGWAGEAKELREDAELVARKVADARLSDAVEQFVDAPKEEQDRIKAEAKEDNLDIMAAILRTYATNVDNATVQRISRAIVAYEEYKVHRDELTDPEDDEGPDNDDAWLFEDLHVLLRLLTRARDKEQMAELLFEGTTSELLKDIITIFYEPLAKVYKAANIADSISDLQAFMTDLIKTVEQVEAANITDPSRTVQAFVDLVGRHEGRFYHFVHQVHSKGEGLFDNLMKWIELFINFVRDGLPERVSLEFLLPVESKERAKLMREVDSIVEYHRQLKQAHHDRMKKRMLSGRGTDADKDAAFVSGVMSNLKLGDVMSDVADVAAADSDDEIDGNDDEDEEERDASSSQETFQSAQPSPSSPSNARSGAAKLERLPPSNAEKKKKSKHEQMMPLATPNLVLIPKLVPVFVELVREQLEHARSQ